MAALACGGEGSRGGRKQETEGRGRRAGPLGPSVLDVTEQLSLARKFLAALSGHRLGQWAGRVLSEGRAAGVVLTARGSRPRLVLAQAAARFSPEL